MSPIVHSAPPPPGRWALEARCLDADPEEFFPSKGKPASAAKRICALCNVREQCLEYALTNDLRQGVWGGLGERERYRLLRRRRAEGRARRPRS